MSIKERINKLLPYLEIFQTPDYEFGEWSKEKGVFPYFTSSSECHQFVHELYENDWVKPFNWGEWQGEAEKLVNDPELIKTTDVETIEKLFTTHVRKNRFCEGHLAAMFQNGHITTLLERLEVIGDTIED